VKIALVGDCQALNPELKRHPDVLYWGRKGLPIWDAELKSTLDNVIKRDSIEKIYFSCGHPFMGCKKSKEIFQLPSGQFIDFTKDERGFFRESGYEKFSTDDIKKICEKYMEMLQFILSLDTRLQLLPITILWHEKIRKSKININPIYDSLKQFPMLNLEFILFNSDFRDRFGNLRESAMNKVISLVL